MSTQLWPNVSTCQNVIHTCLFAQVVKYRVMLLIPTHCTSTHSWPEAFLIYKSFFQAYTIFSDVDSNQFLDDIVFIEAIIFWKPKLSNSQLATLPYSHTDHEQWHN